MKSQLVTAVIALTLVSLALGESSSSSSIISISSSSSTCTKGSDASCLSASTCGPTCCCYYSKVSMMGQNVESYQCAPNPAKLTGTDLANYNAAMSIGTAFGGALGGSVVSYCANSNLLVSSTAILFSAMSLYILA